MPQVHGDRLQPRPVLHGAFTPGGAVPVLTVPHEQRREMSRCSVTSARMSSGRSVTWRRPVLVSGAPDSPAPHPEHRTGSCAATRSG